MGDLRSYIQYKRKCIDELQADIHREVKRIIPEHNSLFFTIGSWKCNKSPIKLCYYNHMEDSALDNCIYCHKPDERK